MSIAYTLSENIRNWDGAHSHACIRPITSGVIIENMKRCRSGLEPAPLSGNM